MYFTVLYKIKNISPDVINIAGRLIHPKQEIKTATIEPYRKMIEAGYLHIMSEEDNNSPHSILYIHPKRKGEVFSKPFIKMNYEINKQITNKLAVDKLTTSSNNTAIIHQQDKSIQSQKHINQPLKKESVIQIPTNNNDVIIKIPNTTTSSPSLYQTLMQPVDITLSSDSSYKNNPYKNDTKTHENITDTTLQNSQNIDNNIIYIQSNNTLNNIDTSIDISIDNIIFADDSLSLINTVTNTSVEADTFSIDTSLNNVFNIDESNIDTLDTNATDIANIMSQDTDSPNFSNDSQMNNVSTNSLIPTIQTVLDNAILSNNNKLIHKFNELNSNLQQQITALSDIDKNQSFNIHTNVIHTNVVNTNATNTNNISIKNQNEIDINDITNISFYDLLDKLIDITNKLIYKDNIPKFNDSFLQNYENINHLQEDNNISNNISINESIILDNLNTLLDKKLTEYFNQLHVQNYSNISNENVSNINKNISNNLSVSQNDIIQSLFKLFIDRQIDDTDLNNIKTFYQQIHILDNISIDTKQQIINATSYEDLITVLLNSVYPTLLQST